MLSGFIQRIGAKFEFLRTTGRTKRYAKKKKKKKE